MDLQAYLQNNFSEKSIMLVGNGPFSDNSSKLVDLHDIVIRFNLFLSDWFMQGLCGRKMNYWVVNLDTGRNQNKDAQARRANLAHHCQYVRSEYPLARLMAASPEEPKLKRLKDAIAFYESQGHELLHPDERLKMPLRKEKNRRLVSTWLSDS